MSASTRKRKQDASDEEEEELQALPSGSEEEEEDEYVQILYCIFAVTDVGTWTSIALDTCQLESRDPSSLTRASAHILNSVRNTDAFRHTDSAMRT